jgi:hypothetical protein
MDPTEILKTIRDEGREPTPWERGQLRALRPNADAQTAEEITALLNGKGDVPAKYRAGQRRAADMGGAYPILAAEMEGPNR